MSEKREPRHYNIDVLKGTPTKRSDEWLESARKDTLEFISGNAEPLGELAAICLRKESLIVAALMTMPPIPGTAKSIANFGHFQMYLGYIHGLAAGENRAISAGLIKFEDTCQPDWGKDSKKR